LLIDQIQVFFGAAPKRCAVFFVKAHPAELDYFTGFVILPLAAGDTLPTSQWTPLSRPQDGR